MVDINLIKQHIQLMLNRIFKFRMIFDYDLKKKYFETISNKLKSPDIWKNPKTAKILRQKSSSLKIFINIVDQLYKNLVDLNDLLELTEEYDKILLSEIHDQLIDLERTLSQLEMSRMFIGKYDDSNCYVDIQSGSGGTEAQDWASMLLRMYLRWMDHKGFITEIIEESTGEITGIKSVTVQVIGSYAYGWLRTESGVHRLVRKSPFDSAGRRHTSFASVFVYPELDDSINIHIRPEDLRCDVYRASGAGGQHVNRTESAVRITHIPTNIVTQCQSDRSQHKNKNQAMKQLKAKLYELELQKKNYEKKMRENNKVNITWGSQIRSYILDNSRVKDLRTGFEKRNVKAVLDGDLDDFIKISIKNTLSETYND
ncbi:peptide chain release factor 2 [Blochmannia endosymbiont of Camponotus sp. C-003]|uniref:peptide chain release factor 2 n=1 Tax=unclassified Candidatus Blochmanniella TaxID=711328 RepID=UPI002023D9C0|nr:MULTISPECIES: peptide chain release factor 2 [unclassified Candidatus Blochmannia]URJ23546.1 peptide chain release factor 2 [Blochmannia endosymbiont of Camponotus sp. C-003]URJ29017.1 peptide chain release factor 2 [Blochmannia endosymbiont of Camponotus sp. C-046]